MKLQSCILLMISMVMSGVCSASLVQVDADKLSVHANDVPLKDVLADLARQTQLKVRVVDGTTLAETRVSHNFSNLTFEQSMIRLLRPWDNIWIKERSTLSIYLFGAHGTAESPITPPATEPASAPLPITSAALISSTETSSTSPADTQLLNLIQPNRPSDANNGLPVMSVAEVVPTFGEVRQGSPNEHPEQLRAASH